MNIHEKSPFEISMKKIHQSPFIESTSKNIEKHESQSPSEGPIRSHCPGNWIDPSPLPLDTAAASTASTASTLEPSVAIWAAATPQERPRSTCSRGLEL